MTVFLVGTGVAGGLDNWVVGASPVLLDAGASALIAVDLVVRTIVVYRRRSSKTRVGVGLVSFASKRRQHTCRNQSRANGVTFTGCMLSS